jgi:putative ABC transport system permease protein
MYRSEQRTGTLFKLFGAIAILISCLGLYGLTTYTAQIKTREIGIRKVLGATIASITTLLAKDFIRLVMLGIVIASPVAWWVMNKWLQDFAYRIQLGWEIFIMAGLIAICIAMLTVSIQALKAALANPVKSLRTE